jgi:hypothetical protein
LRDPSAARFHRRIPLARSDSPHFAHALHARTPQTPCGNPRREFWRGKLASGQRGSPRVARVSSPRSSRPGPTVNFKDLNLSVDDELDSEEPDEGASRLVDEDATNKRAIMARTVSRGAQKSKLVIIMVGLPGRGKTFLCNKLKCYLNW